MPIAIHTIIKVMASYSLPYPLRAQAKHLLYSSLVAMVIRGVVDIQLYWLKIAPLLDKPYENEIMLRGQNIPLKCCQPLELPMHIERGYRSFHTLDIGFVGQRAAKLPSNKL